LRHTSAAGLAAIAVALAASGGTAADPGEAVRVVVFEAPPLGLARALEIQLAGQAEVIVAAPLPAARLEDSLAAAAGVVKARDARLGVWLERSGEGHYVLYAVGVRADRGIVELGRVASGAGANADRILALKVSALVDDLLDEGARVPAALSPSTAPSAPSRPVTAVAEPARPHQRGDLSVIAGAGAAATVADAEPTGLLGLAILGGLRLDRGRLAATVHASGRWFAARRLESASGAGDLTELSAFAIARVGMRTGRVAIGPGLGAGVRRIAVAAEVADGRRGSASRVIPAARLDASLEVRLGSASVAALTAGVEVSLIRDQLTLLGEPLVDAGRFRIPIELSVVLDLL
jgi:hypothetical protein